MSSLNPNSFYKKSTDHLNSVNESYWQHFGVAAGFSLQLMLASLAAIVHAFIPSLFQNTASQTIKKLYEKIAARNAFESHGEL